MTGSSTASDCSPIYSVDGNGSPDGIIDAMVPDNPVQIQFVPENLPENMLSSVENIPELKDMPGWENLLPEMDSGYSGNYSSGFHSSDGGGQCGLVVMMIFIFFAFFARVLYFQ